MEMLQNSFLQHLFLVFDTYIPNLSNYQFGIIITSLHTNLIGEYPAVLFARLCLISNETRLALSAPFQRLHLKISRNVHIILTMVELMEFHSVVRHQNIYLGWSVDVCTHRLKESCFDEPQWCNHT